MAAVDAGLRLQCRFHPVDSLLFPIIAFAGIVGAAGLQQMIWTNLIVKSIITLLIFWTIYLVPEKPIYDGD